MTTHVSRALSPLGQPGGPGQPMVVAPSLIALAALFADEDRAYAERLRACGVEATLDVVPGAPHGFETWAPDSTLDREHVTRAHAWLRGTLDVPD